MRTLVHHTSRPILFDEKKAHTCAHAHTHQRPTDLPIPPSNDGKEDEEMCARDKIKHLLKDKHHTKHTHTCEHRNVFIL